MNAAGPAGVLRHWLAFCIALMLVIAPPLNLAAIEPALASPTTAASIDHCPTTDEQRHHHSGPGHHAIACLQCLALGGMALAGADSAPDLAPTDYVIASGWTQFSHVWASRPTPRLSCRGPPAAL
jgi:hypothetical protein